MSSGDSRFTGSSTTTAWVRGHPDDRAAPPSRCSRPCVSLSRGIAMTVADAVSDLRRHRQRERVLRPPLSRRGLQRRHQATARRWAEDGGGRAGGSAPPQQAAGRSRRAVVRTARGCSRPRRPECAARGVHGTAAPAAGASATRSRRAVDACRRLCPSASGQAARRRRPSRRSV